MITLKTLILLVSILSQSPPTAATDFLFNSFTNTTNLLLIRDARIEPPVIRLSNDSNQWSVGRAFYSERIAILNNNLTNFPANLTNFPASNVSVASFSTQFVFSILPEIASSPGFGITFVLCNTTEPVDAIGGQYLGLFSNRGAGTPAPLLAVEFDTGANNEFNESNGNHVGIDLNNVESVVSVDAGYWDQSGGFVRVDMRNGQNVHAWIEFDGARMEINVTIAPAGVRRPSRPLLSYRNAEIGRYLSSEMYVGFSASKTTWVEAQRVLAWSFSDTGVARDLNTSGLPVFLARSEGSSGLSTGGKVGVICGAVVFFICVLGVCYYAWVRYKAKSEEDVAEDWELEFWPHRYSYEDQKAATNGFSDTEVLGALTYVFFQDFKALTPNLLARTIETVEGGGLVIMLLRSLSSLTSLYTMVMDVHERFRTESHTLATGRFNERFLLSLASCGSCIVMDDELNILPISSHMKSVTPVPVKEDSEGLSEAERELKDMKEELKDAFPVGPLIKKCCTHYQAKAVSRFLEAILDTRLRSTVALLTGRGCGKLAALGLAIAGAVAAGYSNIFVTAPSPENLKTLFGFITKGFDMLEYKEHLDYDIVKSSNPELKKVTTRINIYKQHRQTIQYIQPHEYAKLSQVELLVVDEAAAIPLPIVKSLLGPYLVFLSSTVNGYEGTGRSLSLKLLQQLEEQSRAPTKDTEAVSSGRLFKKIELNEAIRYASGDPVELWLNNLLCLDIANSIPSINSVPPPSECDLYYVNRDTLFSYHKDSELFLQRMMALYVASHYKNSPNDLQLLADAPAHHLFVLLGPVNESKNQLPDILCVIQVCLEGKISKASAMRSLSAGHSPSGDQIPWKFCEQFQDKDFPSLSGARIVRIATHPNATRSGYGSAAIELLSRYFEGQFTPISEVDDDEDDHETPDLKITEAAEKVSLLEENIKPRSDLPPLLVHLRERRPEKLHYLGVSFGLTMDLFRFWRRHKFAPFYICEVPNSVTGEHTCMLLKPLDTDDIEVNGSDELGFFGPYYRAFKSSFAKLLCSPRFNTMDYKLAMSILDPKLDFADVEPSSTISLGIYDDIINSPISMRRLEAYVNHLADHHLISDLKLSLAHLYFQERLPVSLSYTQASVLLCMGLQNQDASYTQKAIEKLDYQQIMIMFMKVMKKFHKYLASVSSKQFAATLPQAKEVDLKPHSISVDEDLDEAAKKVKNDLKDKSDGLLNPDFLQRYAIADKDVDFESALQNGGKVPSGGVISVKSNKTKAEKYEKRKDKSDKKRSKDGSSSKSSKKKRTA